MNPNSKKNLKSVLIIAGLSSLGIVIFSIAITIGLKNQINEQLTSSISTTSKSSEIANTSSWDENIVLSLPTDLVGGSEQFDVTNEVPSFKNAFHGETVKYSIGATSNEMVITKEGSNLLDASRYMDALNDYLSVSDVIAFPSTDYLHDEILSSVVFVANDHYLVISTKSELQMQYLYIRYVPKGNEYWVELDNYFNYDVISLIPGMNLNAEPIVSSDVNSLTIEYDASIEEIQLYQYRLENLFGYEDIGSGILSNKYLNTVFIDMSVPNTLVISAETK